MVVFLPNVVEGSLATVVKNALQKAERQAAKRGVTFLQSRASTSAPLVNSNITRDSFPRPDAA